MLINLIGYVFENALESLKIVSKQEFFKSKDVDETEKMMLWHTYFCIAKDILKLLGGSLIRFQKKITNLLHILHLT